MTATECFCLGCISIVFVCDDVLMCSLCCSCYLHLYTTDKPADYCLFFNRPCMVH